MNNEELRRAAHLNSESLLRLTTIVKELSLKINGIEIEINNGRFADSEIVDMKTQNEVNIELRRRIIQLEDRSND